MPRGPGTYGSKVGRPSKKSSGYMEDVAKADNYVQFSRMRPDVRITKEGFDRLKAGVPRQNYNRIIRAPDVPIRTRPDGYIPPDVPTIRAPDMPVRTRPEGYIPPEDRNPRRRNSKGGKVSAYKKGGKVSSRGDGIARTGKTRGKIC
jgi:hypothetical protein